MHLFLLSLAMLVMLWTVLALPAMAGPSIPEEAAVVLSDNLEGGRAEGWSGGQVLADEPGHAYRATGPQLILTRRVSLTATKHTYVSFRYFAQGCYSLGVQFKDRTKGENFKTFICPIQRGQWTSVTFNIRDIQGCTKHTDGIAVGDKLADMLIWPMEKLPGASLQVRDVAIYHLTPRARAILAVRDAQAAVGRESPPEAIAPDLARLQEEAATVATEEAADTFVAKAVDLGQRVRRAELLLRMRKAHGPAAGYVVGVELPTVRVTHRNPTMPFSGRIERSIELAAAAHEYENVQLVVIPVEKRLEKVRLAASDLTSPAGTIAKANLEWRLTDDVQTKPSYGYARGLHGWKPDPLLPGVPFDAEVGQLRCVWVTAYVPPETPPGLYEGTLKLATENAEPTEIALRLRVWNFRLPLRGRFRHMCQFMPQSDQKRRENYAFVLKYRMSPTAQYSRSVATPAAAEIAFCLERGITTFVAGNHPGPEINVELVRPYYEALKAAGALDLAVIYIGDEGTSTEALRQFRAKATLVKREFPGLRVMVGGSTPRPELVGFLDVWDPIISMNAPRGKGYEYNQAACDERLAAGEEVLWYMAGVRPPYTCIELDPPATSMRAWPWVTWKYGVQGWEVYGTQGGWDKPTNKTWPKTAWDTYTWRTYNGSGQFFYPGPDGVPLASIRIENARDGIEDYESLHLLREAVELARLKKPTGVTGAQLAEAERVLSVRPEVMTHMWDWSRQPAAYERARHEVSRLLDALVTALGREAFDQYVAEQAQARRRRTDELYEQRLKAFLATQPAGQ